MAEYVEYLPGEKHAATDPATSDSLEAFRDAGYKLSTSDIVIDIDHVPKHAIEAMIHIFNIHTRRVWTDRGIHLFFRKPEHFKAKDGVCRLGFEIEQLTKSKRPNGITVKRNGIARKVEDPDLIQVLPEIFYVNKGKRQFQNLLGLSEGEGREKALFEHRRMLANCNDWEKILRFINEYVFADPLEDGEFEHVAREMDITYDTDDKLFVVRRFMNDYRTLKYAGDIWIFRNGRYERTTKDSLKFIICGLQECDEAQTKDIDEIYKQIEYRSPTVPADKVLPVRLKNGVAFQDGFFYVSEYTDFTPYYIDIEYDVRAKPVEVVDDYLGNLSDHNQEYRQLILEVLGYCLVTDPDTVRGIAKFFIFRGDGGNGKGTLLQIIKTILGKQNCSTLSIKDMTKESYMVTIVGKLVNLGDDIQPDAINNDMGRILKNTSTADDFALRKLYGEAFNYQPITKMIFTSNTDIKSYEKGYAMQRRLLWMPMFNKPVSGGDPQFIKKITTPEALNYWIKLIVNGYYSLLARGNFLVPDVVKEYNDQYNEYNNPMLTFVKTLDPDTEILLRKPEELEAAYKEWCTDDTPFQKKPFFTALWDEYQIGIGVTRIAGKNTRVFLRASDTTQKLRH